MHMAFLFPPPPFFLKHNPFMQYLTFSWSIWLSGFKEHMCSHYLLLVPGWREKHQSLDVEMLAHSQQGLHVKPPWLSSHNCLQGPGGIYSGHLSGNGMALWLWGTHSEGPTTRQMCESGWFLSPVSFPWTLALIYSPSHALVPLFIHPSIPQPRRKILYEFIHMSPWEQELSFLHLQFPP